LLVKPWLHVQLLHAIILGPGWGYCCQSVRDCVTSYQKMSSTKNYCYYQQLRQQRRFHWWHLACSKRKRKHAKRALELCSEVTSQSDRSFLCSSINISTSLCDSVLNDILSNINLTFNVY